MSHEPGEPQGWQEPDHYSAPAAWAAVRSDADELPMLKFRGGPAYAGVVSAVPSVRFRDSCVEWLDLDEWEAGARRDEREAVAAYLLREGVALRFADAVRAGRHFDSARDYEAQARTVSGVPENTPARGLTPSRCA